MGLGSYKTSLKILRSRPPPVRKINSRWLVNRNTEIQIHKTNTQMHTIMHMLVTVHLRLCKIAHVSDFDFVWLLSSFCFEKLASHIYSHLIRKQLWKKRRFGKVGFCAVAQRECGWIVGRAILVKRQLLLSSVCSRDVTIGRILPQKAPVQNTLLVLT